jgi:excinuclease UvrABC ATPase subunit
VHVRYRNRYGRTRSYYADFEGVLAFLQRKMAQTESDQMKERIVHTGTYHELLANKHSITGAYLSGNRSIEMPATRRPVDKQRQLTSRKTSAA